MLRIVILDEDEARLVHNGGGHPDSIYMADLVLAAKRRVEYAVVKDRYGVGQEVIEALGDKPLDKPPRQ